MIKIDDIRHLHIEASSLCNARCPLCPRNVFGYNHNCGYTETNLELSLVTRSFSSDFLKQIGSVLINGNFGDFVSNLEIIEILGYFRQCNPNIDIEISTNASARGKRFWQDLGELCNITVGFCLDGIDEDTHQLYRQDTSWSRILQNAQVFIAAGGTAMWKMIPFDHNRHQIEDCKALAKELGFTKFFLTDSGRDSGLAFDRDGNFSHKIGGSEIAFDSARDAIDYINSNPRFALPKHDPNIQPHCETKDRRSIYIAADGKVYPCCYLGFSPETYKSSWIGFLNKQIAPLVERNSLYTHTLEECLTWFNKVESSWTKDRYEDGRLMQCDAACGRNNNSYHQKLP